MGHNAEPPTPLPPPPPNTLSVSLSLSLHLPPVYICPYHFFFTHIYHPALLSSLLFFPRLPNFAKKEPCNHPRRPPLHCLALASQSHLRLRRGEIMQTSKTMKCYFPNCLPTQVRRCEWIRSGRSFECGSDAWFGKRLSAALERKLFHTLSLNL